METRFSNEQVKQVFFLILISFLGILLFRNLYGLFSGFLGAVTIYVLCRQLYFYLTEKKGWGRALTAALMMVLSLAVLVVPVALLINMLSGKASGVFNNTSALMDGLRSIGESIHTWTGYDLMSAENLGKLQGAAGEFLPKFFGATFNALTSLGIMYFMLYFMFVNGRAMERAMYEYIPLKTENVLRLGHEVNSMVISNAIGIPVIAIIQSIFALAGYWIFGVQDPFFWFVVTCFTAMLPVIGSTIVWLPLAVQLYVTDHHWQGIGLIIWGFAVVGMADNLFRILLAKKIGDTHPLITIFGVIIGVNLFGFIGLIFGPLLITMFLLLLKIYSNEYFEKKREAAPEPAPAQTRSKKKGKK